MSEDMDMVLRSSLDAVDQSRRWAIILIAALLIAAAAALAAFIATVAAATNAPVGLALQALCVASGAQMLLVAYCTAWSHVHVRRMTRTVLRAVELSSRSR